MVLPKYLITSLPFPTKHPKSAASSAWAESLPAKPAQAFSFRATVLRLCFRNEVRQAHHERTLSKQSGTDHGFSFNGYAASLAATP